MMSLRLAVPALGICLAACGSTTKHSERHSEDELPRAAPVVVRGHWELVVTRQAPNEVHLMDAVSKATGTQSMSASIVANVEFNLDNSTYIASPTITDTTSYGALGVTTLHDNNVAVCGTDGTTQCSTGGIRIYTQGQPGAGMWNAAGAYGAPLSTGGQTIGLNAAGAYTLATAAITANTHVLHLSNFTSQATLSIPLTVDYSNAGVGSYATTVVVEYFLQ